MINSKTKSNLGKKAFISAYNYQVHIPSLKESGQELKQDWNLEVGTEGGVMGDVAYWSGPYGLLSILNYSTLEHQPRSDTAHSELGLAFSF